MSEKRKYWAIILGASSGFGEATALQLARDGYNIAGVHLDRQITLPNVQRIIADIESSGVEALFFNVNAADSYKREEVINVLKSKLEGRPLIKVLLHSLAFGTLRPFVQIEEDKSGITPITKAQMEMTLDVMAHSLVYWVQDLIKNNLFERGGRIFAMTSSGSHTSIPHYGAVSAAKAALESHVRQLTLELGLMNIGVNAIMAGVTDTPAFRKIPGNRAMLKVAKLKNPRNRWTTPDDVAKIISLLCREGGEWISGCTIHADGGEDIVNFVGQGLTELDKE